MRFSTRVRYGVRLMFELALNYDEGQISLREIASRQDVSEKYLEQVVAPLKSAGLVRSVRGRHGGYVLTRPPSEIRLSGIHTVLEGPVMPVECLEDAAICDREESCAARDVWREVRDAVNEVLESTTLQDLVDRHREKLRSGAQSMYYI